MAEWISVNAKLPDKGTRVLVLCNRRTAVFGEIESRYIINIATYGDATQYEEIRKFGWYREGLIGGRWTTVKDGWHGSHIVADNIVAWMPLPEPPKEVQG